MEILFRVLDSFWLHCWDNCSNVLTTLEDGVKS